MHGPCCHCGAVSSPQWRKGPKGKPVLCNACGIRFLRTRSLGKVPVSGRRGACTAAAAAAAARPLGGRRLCPPLPGVTARLPRPAPPQVPTGKRSGPASSRGGKPSLLLPRQGSLGSELDSPSLSALDSPDGIELPPDCSLESPILAAASSLESELLVDELSM